jgi:hypothetical protein
LSATREDRAAGELEDLDGLPVVTPEMLVELVDESARFVAVRSDGGVDHLGEKPAEQLIVGR